MVSHKAFSNPHREFNQAIRQERELEPSDGMVTEWTVNAPDVAAWDAPLVDDPPLTKEEKLVRAHQDHVELTALIIPHWLISVAEGNDVLCMESFLNALNDNNEAWSKRVWAGKRGATLDAKSNSAYGSRSQTGSRTASVLESGWAFVERIATEEAADEARKERLHTFYQMPTEEKLKKIEEIVRSLRD
ncbi:hypothetical protein C8F01DRAFT_1109345 [Mycena amicta]|nr:hypothetical protein C8F01DRAFT_1109345 [Mycena amicta]